ncbi:DUF2306 domain-containing protein [Actinomadura madurae]|uniref:DUF2306 domain-containing protein n=1 Tax=Actinomadura madurae TaxID=1993 RepID=A0A1I5GJQ8_9ACTN|nr:DUF2306 domain-containing protein [Actinomadura madurae]SFO36170.1 hypothetical protein SAMN04489713_105240 [Actinomadura madurae]SPT51354.1 Uncharacterised protein [Actinomadura madurae]
MLLDGVIIVHIGAGLTAVITGIDAMRVPKRPGRHPRRGRIYLGALVLVAVTASGIAAARPHTAYLLILGALALAAAGVGYAARRMRWRGWQRHHITTMAISYITLLTAFYVDNGPRLPLWKLLPPITFWFLPAAIGLPLLLRALHRYPSRPSHRPAPSEGTLP